MKTLRSLAIAAALVGFGAVAHADGSDTSSDAASFTAKVDQSQGVIVRVPVNAQGQEDTANAELRLQVGNAPLSAAQDSVTAWSSAVDTSSVPVVGGDVNSDTSTNHRDDYYGYGWQNYRGNGWENSYYYYYNYTPTYYYSSYRYVYYQPVYYDRIYSNGCGHRYYYYPRRWRW